MVCECWMCFKHYTIWHNNTRCVRFSFFLFSSFFFALSVVRSRLICIWLSFNFNSIVCAGHRHRSYVSDWIKMVYGRATLAVYAHNNTRSRTYIYVCMPLIPMRFVTVLFGPLSFVVICHRYWYCTQFDSSSNIRIHKIKTKQKNYIQNWWSRTETEKYVNTFAATAAMFWFSLLFVWLIDLLLMFGSHFISNVKSSFPLICKTKSLLVLDFPRSFYRVQFSCWWVVLKRFIETKSFFKLLLHYLAHWFHNVARIWYVCIIYIAYTLYIVIYRTH